MQQYRAKSEFLILFLNLESNFPQRGSAFVVAAGGVVAGLRFISVTAAALGRSYVIQQQRMGAIEKIWGVCSWGSEMTKTSGGTQERQLALFLLFGKLR